MTKLSATAAIRRFVLADGLLTHSAKLGAGAAASLVIALVATPVLTRLYSPDAFGLLGVFSALLAVLSLVSTGRYEQAIALPEHDADALAVARVARRIVLVTSLAAGLFLPFRHRIADLLDRPDLALWLWTVPAGMWLSGEIQVASAWAVRRSQYGRVAGARVAQAVAAVTLQLSLVFAGPVALLSGVLGGLAVQFGTLRRTGRGASAAGQQTIAGAAREHRRFPIYILPAALIDTLTLQLPAMLGAAWFGTAFVGFYTIAMRVLSLPATVMGGAFGQVFYQEFSRRASQPADARRLLFHTWLKLAALGAVPLLLLAHFGEPLFQLVFGPEWRTAGSIAVVVSPMVFAMLVSSPTSGALLVLGRQQWSPVFSAAFLGYRVFGFWFGARHGDYLLGLALVAAAEIVTIIAYNGIIVHRLAARSA